MRFFSTQGAHETDFIGAVSQGLAPDGCLYVPEELPRFDPGNIEGDSLEDIGAQLLRPLRLVRRCAAIGIVVREGV